jgi:ribosome maturation factor RimP
MNIAEITEKSITERAQAALPSQLALYKIAFFHTKGNMRVVVQLDKPADAYGSVNIGECEAYSRRLRDSLDELEKTSGMNLNYSLEVSSAGAERELTSIAEVRRFSALPLAVTFTAEGGKVLSEVMKATAIEGETLVLNLADCKLNRKRMSPKKIQAAPSYRVEWTSIKKIRLHLDV